MEHVLEEYSGGVFSARTFTWVAYDGIYKIKLAEVKSFAAAVPSFVANWLAELLNIIR